MDPLSDVLSLLKPQTYVTGGLSAGEPWAISLPAYRGIKCYTVIAGKCWLSIQGVKDAVYLQAGTCLLLPHGRPFVLASDLTLPAVDAREIISSVERYNGVLRVTPGNGFFVLGAHFALDGDARFLLDVLPTVVIIDSEADRASIRWAVERMLREMRDFKPGGSLVAQQLAYTLLVEALRLHIADGTQKDPGWLLALADTRVAAALSCIHEKPAHSWTLEELARSVGMSRTAFAHSFKAKVGEPALAYITRWRMTLAANRLQATGDPISLIARSLGYQSESAFSAAFKRQWGSSPRQYINSIRAHLGSSRIA